jgi:hypothetical protein
VLFSENVATVNPFRINTRKMHKSSEPNPLYNQHFQKGDYVFDTGACYGRETMGGEYRIGILPDPADPVIMRVG